VGDKDLSRAGTKKLHQNQMEFFNKHFLRLQSTHATHATHAAHARRTAFPFSWTAPWNGLIVWVAIEATSHRESKEGKGKEECNAMIHSRFL
jgi:hypothetical protein